MNRRTGYRISLFFILLATCLPLPLEAAAPQTDGGSMKIIMKDGTSISDIPYYWEEAGEVKFEYSGGIVGVPKDQVASIKEVLTIREFDPDAMRASTGMDADLRDLKDLRDMISKEMKAAEGEQGVSLDSTTQWTSLANSARKKALESSRIHGPIAKVRGDFPKAIAASPEQTRLLVRKILFSKSDLTPYRFELTLYNGNGGVLQTKPCELTEIKLDRKKLRRMKIRDRIYELKATIDPTPEIARYDITAIQP